MQRSIPNTAPATKLGNVKPGTKIHLQVLNGAGNNTVRIAERPDLLDNPEPFGGSSGMAFTSNNGVVEIVWQWAEVWAAGLAANTSIPVVYFDGGSYG